MSVDNFLDESWWCYEKHFLTNPKKLRAQERGPLLMKHDCSYVLVTDIQSRLVWPYLTTLGSQGGLWPFPSYCQKACVPAVAPLKTYKRTYYTCTALSPRNRKRASQLWEYNSQNICSVHVDLLFSSALGITLTQHYVSQLKPRLWCIVTFLLQVAPTLITPANIITTLSPRNEVDNRLACSRHFCQCCLEHFKWITLL